MELLSFHKHLTAFDFFNWGDLMKYILVKTHSSYSATDTGDLHIQINSEN